MSFWDVFVDFGWVLKICDIHRRLQVPGSNSDGLGDGHLINIEGLPNIC